jgi:chromate reductase, NAD(P)H dehydrogenase (quinone)
MNSSPIRVLGISGSLREGSYNTKLLLAACEMMPDDMQMDIFNLASLPVYNDDLRREGYPEPVKEFRQQIAAADALLIATPEYNHSIPGVLKNALDWASRPPDPPLVGKPVAIMGVSTGNFGTVRAQLHLRQVLFALNSQPVNKPEMLVARAAEKFDSDGHLIDETTRTFLRDLLFALKDKTLRVQLLDSTLV